MTTDTDMESGVRTRMGAGLETPVDMSAGAAPAYPAYPAMRELLRQCVAETQAAVAFVALLDPAGAGKRTALAIPAMFPLSQQRARCITRWVRQGVCAAIEAGRTKVIAGRSSGRNVQHRGTRILIVVPMYTTNGRAWGAVAVVRESAAVDSDIIASIEQCARTVTTLLTQGDDPLSRFESAVPPPLPRSRPRLNSGPRDDFVLHELRVPLSAASFALEALSQRHGPNWQRDDEHLLHTAQSGVVEAQRIMRTASQWPALGNGMTMPVFEALDLSEAVEHALTLLPAARYRVLQKLDRGLSLVFGNVSWITHVLMNLLENALKYSSTRREIEVSAHQIDSDYVLVGVRSWGEGVAFDRDMLTHSSEHSAAPDDLTSKGLGLNIARYFVTSMGGEIWMEGDGTNGITVTLALPTARAWSSRIIHEA